MDDPRFADREMPPALRQALAVQREFMEEEFRHLRREMGSKSGTDVLAQKVWMIIGGVSVLAVLGMFILGLWTNEGSENRRSIQLGALERESLKAKVMQLERDLIRLDDRIDKNRTIVEQLYRSQYHREKLPRADP